MPAMALMWATARSFTTPAVTGSRRTSPKKFARGGEILERDYDHFFETLKQGDFPNRTSIGINKLMDSLHRLEGRGAGFFRGCRDSASREPAGGDLLLLSPKSVSARSIEGKEKSVIAEALRFGNVEGALVDGATGDGTENALVGDSLEGGDIVDIGNAAGGDHRN